MPLRDSRIMTMTKKLSEFKKTAISWMIPWSATIKNALPYNKHLSWFVDKIVHISEVEI
jgi:hypothetical protein